MITLPHHVEFLSDAWLEEAGAFLRREAAHRRDRLGDKAFSVSERFTDAPPHLEAPGDVADWTMRWDGEAITASRGFDADADLVVEGDYQAALTAAQFVGVLAPGAQEAMIRETARMCGDHALSARGAVENEAARE